MDSTQKLFLYFHLLLLLFITSVSPSPLYKQSQSLLSLKSHLTDTFNTLKDWSTIKDSDNISCCSWSGIKCNQDSTTIISINLSSKNLAGTLPNNIFLSFPDLLSLNLSKNNFSGHFPNNISNLNNLIILDALSNSFTGPLPNHLPNLINLKVLNLAGSYFSGSIPVQFGSFKSLEFLHLGGNLLTGPIPEQLGNLTTLRHMEIGYNSYHGAIPWQLGNMKALNYLDIADANISGFLPKHFKNLTNLESLFLFSNHLSGEIPWEFGEITSLANLDLSDNKLCGSIPQSFVMLQNLKLLSLMYNEMNGTLPDAIADLASLDTLFIWNNYFTGSLPKRLGMNSDLRWVDVSSNGFVGEIPQGICSRGVLLKLMLFSNNFSGGLSTSLSNCSTLVRIRLEDNSFSGVVPFRFSKMVDISYIDISRNKLTGGIPRDISEAKKLEYFNISNNPELGGELPPRIWSAPRLRNFSAFSCGIFGRLPLFESCKFITVIELSNNDISGMLPPTVSDCYSLRKMDLSYNNLSGSIPSDKVFRSMGKDAYEGNVNLCGFPLKPCKGYRSRKLVSVLVACLISILLIAAGVLGVYYIRQRSNGRWKMVSFPGLPHFTADDVLRSFGSPDSPCKTVLPTGISVIVRKIELQGKKEKGEILKVLMQMGNARHVNLVRLLGFCYNNHLIYVLYDNDSHTGTLSENMQTTKMRDWETKKRIIKGVANGLCFLHHDCYPAIPHGDVKSSNVLLLDDEPCLDEFGFKYVLQLNKGLHTDDVIRAEKQKDVFDFGELVLEILTNGKLKNAGRSIQTNAKKVFLREVYAENEVSSSNGFEGEVKRVVEVALLCIRSNDCDRPCMEEVLRFLSEADKNRF